MRALFLIVAVLILSSCSKDSDTLDTNLVDINLAKCVNDITVPAEEVTEISCRLKEIENLSGISKYKNLEVLDLTWNQIIDISPLQGLDHLTNVYLAGNPIEGYSVFKELPKLKMITISSFDLSDIKVISSIDTIEYIGVEDDELSAGMIFELENLPELLFLSFSTTGMQVFPDLSGLNALTFLSVRGEQTLQAISNIELLSGLIYLSISDINVENLSFISEFYELEHLTVGSTDEFNIETVENLPNLRWLSIYHTKLLGDVQKLVTMPDLTSLKMYGVINLSCVDVETLQEEFGDIYFENIEEKYRTCIQ